MTVTLRRRGHPLASASAQRDRLQQIPLPRFEDSLRAAGLHPLRPTTIDTLQINVGKQCNQVCHHCHVDAGPERDEIMTGEVVDACLRLLEAGDFTRLDITGGAPEMHPRFDDIVRRARRMGRHVMHRCNLTAILLRPYEHVPELLAEHGVEVVASLPYYLPRQTDAQRGEGVFERSLAGLRRLNELGYGQPDRGLVLNLVTNPVGAFLPARQESLESDYRRELRRRFGIVFDHLFTITNMPISRFLQFLVDSGNLEGYLDRLVQAFNPIAAAGVMCRTLVSVGHDGIVYDCDFNQMLEMPANLVGRAHVLRNDPRALLRELRQRRVAVGPHCYGCTAGAGSSCGGATA